jgi:hypothetical protein
MRIVPILALALIGGLGSHTEAAEKKATKLEQRAQSAAKAGNHGERIAADRFDLDSSFTHIVSSTVIEQSVSAGGDPTHGVLVGDCFYYIGSSGWAALDEKGQVKPLVPGIMEYRLS